MEEKHLKSSQGNIRKSYYQGFMDGLSHKFKLQRDQMSSENEKFALMIKTPQDVVDKFNAEIQGQLAFKQPILNTENEAYSEGYEKGTKVSLSNKYLN